MAFAGMREATQSERPHRSRRGHRKSALPSASIVPISGKPDIGRRSSRSGLPQRSSWVEQRRAFIALCREHAMFPCLKGWCPDR